MPLITLRDIRLSVGHPPLLDGIDLAIERGERICLVGRNGTGKSTLLRILSGEIQPDAGEIARTQGLRVARLEQDVPRGIAGSVFHVVADGLGETGALLERHHALSLSVAEGEPDALAALERCQQEIEARGGWDYHARVETVLSRLQLPADEDIATLSGGLRRRVMLARALVSDPDLLLLDEPTNHLDIAAIEWLEGFLAQWPGTLLFITHDRAFLQKLATRIVELDRGAATDFPGDYATYLRRKEELLADESRHNALFDRKLAQEEVWIRQGIKARRTRNEGRVRALLRLREERAARREATGQARMQAQEAARSGRLVAEAEGVGFAFGDRWVVRGFDATIMRGDRIGIIGPNGAGKTTLLRLLLGELDPTEGRIRRGTNLDVAYFDQYRATLDESRSAQWNVAEGRDMLDLGGKPRHVLSYLQDFLFAPDRARQPVHSLSGGERNRLLLARLFARPSNMLVLDEPTNDLDIDTLDLLQEVLADYAGTVLLVSHDRDFLDRVVTGTLAFEGDARVREYVGGYADWLRQRPAAEAPRPKPQAAPRPEPRRATARRLSFKEQRELDGLPALIERLEAEHAALAGAMGGADFYRQARDAIAAAQARAAGLEAELAAAYARWEELEALRG